MFSKKNYYNFPNRKNEPILEDMFAKIETNNYNTITGNIENRMNLGFETKQLLVDWILMMKYRTAKVRDNFSEVVSWTEKTMHKLRTKGELSRQDEKELEDKGKAIGKGIQLSAFLDKEQHVELRKSFFTNFMSRNWVIMKTTENNFITSDNPGYSFTISKDLIRLNMSPISSMYNLKKESNSIHVFPLTYDKCLFLVPLSEAEAIEITKNGIDSHLHKEISFKECRNDEVKEINDSTASTAHELIIAKNENDIESYLNN